MLHAEENAPCNGQGSVVWALDDNLLPCLAGGRPADLQRSLEPCGGFLTRRPGAPPLLVVWVDAAGSRRLAAEGEHNLLTLRTKHAPGAALALVIDRAPGGASLLQLQAAMLLDGEASLIHVGSRGEQADVIRKLVTVALTPPVATSFLGSCSVFKAARLPYEDEALATWLKMLIQVPGLSEDVAEAIVEGGYHSWGDLMDMLEDETRTAAEKQELLADLLRPSRDGQPRKRVGPALAKRVIQFFLGSEPDAMVR